MDIPTREVYWNVHAYVLLMYAMAAVSVGAFLYGFYRKISPIKIGAHDISLDRWPERLRGVYLWEKRFFRQKTAGFMHFVMLWGAVLLFLGTVVVFIHEDLRIRIMAGSFYLVFQSLILDIAGFLAIVGMIVALARRHLFRPARLANGTAADSLLLVLLLALLVTGFLVQGVRIVATRDLWGAWSPVGLAFGVGISPLIADPGAQLLAHKSLWLLHAALAFATIGIIPYTKLGHLIVAPVNVFLRPLDGTGIPRPIDFEKEGVLGVATISDFTAKQLLDLEACTACGRCEERCPAARTNKPLSPRQLILDLRSELRARRATGVGSQKPDQEKAEPAPADLLVPRAIADEAIWSCTTCLACQKECPAHIEPVPKIIGLRRYQVMEVGEFPAKLEEASNSLEKRGHPFTGISVSRAAWMEGLDDVDAHLNAKEAGTLFWVGCSAALNERTMKIAAAFYRVLTAAGIEFRILGTKEPCCGDPVRRIGNEYQYASIVQQNLDTFKSQNITSIVTTCPHCFSAFKNDYAQFGGNLNVTHHSQFILDLMRSGKISLAGTADKKLTYHDPCYLGRYNDVYEPPRAVLAGARLVEMPSSRSSSTCCGGGGGRFWIDEQPQSRVSYLRMQEIIDSRAEAVVTACPFCMLMLDEAAKSKAKGQVEVIDLAEWVLQRIGTSDAVPV
ncbi:MAG: respiratory nitrate reductase subunit gamma [Chloroflexi bacterium]|nr:respiratory nitrate reductase subunit gamma [Chloroflexota bacterium]